MQRNIITIPKIHSTNKTKAELYFNHMTGRYCHTLPSASKQTKNNYSPHRLNAKRFINRPIVSQRLNIQSAIYFRYDNQKKYIERCRITATIVKKIT